MNKLFKFALAIALLCASASAQKINLATQATPAISGPGQNGQVLISNGAGSFAPGDPIISPNQDAELTASWTNATSNNAALIIPVSQRSTVTVSFNPSGTISAGTVSFEVTQDNSTWKPKIGVREDGSGADLSYSLSGAAQSWTFAVAGYVNFRVRLSPVITGSGTVIFGAIAQSTGSPNLGLFLAQQSGSWNVAISNFPASQTVNGSVSVSNFPATQPISAATLPLPTGAATSANQPALVSGRTPVDPSGVTSPVSAASLPLPSGASTSAKQPALGTAGTPSPDVISIQGVTSMTPLKTDGSGVTQPVSGTITANAGSGTMAVSAASLPLPSGAAQDATLTGGTTKVINRGGAKGSTTAADVTSTASGANHQALDVAQYDASGNQLGLSGTPVRTDPTGTTTQPVSGTVTANQGGTWTVQPGNTANTTAWKVDGSAVTQPISASSLPLPAGAATSANQSTVKAASTQAAATDTSSVVQLNPNQPNLTIPLNVRGAKTNNNAAPDATEIGDLPALANASPPSSTEGNEVKLSIDLKGNLRVNNHPPDVLGCYMVNGRTGTYGGLSALTPLFSMRWGDATHFAVIQSVKINVATTTAATAATQAERELIIARSFTVADTGGTAVTLTGNNQKMRTSQATSLVSDMRFGQPLTAGTRTLDANPVSSAVSFLALNMTGMDIGCGSGGPFVSGTAWTCVGGLGMVPLLDVFTGDYPIVLAQNEGIVVRIGKDAQPTTAVQQTYVTVKWCEVNAF